MPDQSSPESPMNPLNALPTTLPVAKSVHHRKSRSTDLGLTKLKQPEEPCKEQPTRRKSISPSVTIKPQIVVPSIKEPKPKFVRNSSYDQPKAFDQSKSYSSRQEESGYTDWLLGDGKPMISTTSPTISSSTPIIHSKSNTYYFTDNTSSRSISTESKPPTPQSPTAPRLERSLSSVSSRSVPNSRNRSPAMHQPPEIIRVSFDNSMNRMGSSPAGINRRPVSMYSSDQFDDSDLMGDFLAGLQNNSDYVGDRAGRFRRVSGRW